MNANRFEVFGQLLRLKASSSNPSWPAQSFAPKYAAPGLLDHRLYERNVQVGDVRVLRKDFSPLWFIAGNHVLTYEVVVAGLRRLVKPKAGETKNHF